MWGVDLFLVVVGGLHNSDCRFAQGCLVSGCCSPRLLCCWLGLTFASMLLLLLSLLSLLLSQPLPDALRGEKWAFVQLPLSNLREMLKPVGTVSVCGEPGCCAHSMGVGSRVKQGKQ